MPTPSASQSPTKHKVSIRSSLKADVTPWWIVSVALLVIGSSAIYAASKRGR